MKDPSNKLLRQLNAGLLKARFFWRRGHKAETTSWSRHHSCPARRSDHSSTARSAVGVRWPVGGLPHRAAAVLVCAVTILGATAPARAQTDPPPSDDATLGALALTDTDTGNAIGLDPSFARDVLAYAAEVATDVRTITMEAAANHSSATLKYMNGKEGALSDVDTDTDGFQVGLLVGTTVFKVQVEAENGAKQIYSASMMRQGPPFSLTVDTIAGDDVVNIREKADGFTVSGDAESGDRG